MGNFFLENSEVEPLIATLNKINVKLRKVKQVICSLKYN